MALLFDENLYDYHIESVEPVGLKAALETWM